MDAIPEQESKLIQNCIFIPEDDVYLNSGHSHDFRTHVFKNGGEISVDGGTSYIRRCGDLRSGRYEEFNLRDTDPFEGHITERLVWGSAGKRGTEPMTFRPIKDWALRPEGKQHLEAILRNIPNIRPMHKRVVEYWLLQLEKAKVQKTRKVSKTKAQNERKT